MSKNNKNEKIIKKIIFSVFVSFTGILSATLDVRFNRGKKERTINSYR